MATIGGERHETRLVFASFYESSWDGGGLQDTWRGAQGRGKVREGEIQTQVHRGDCWWLGWGDTGAGLGFPSLCKSPRGVYTEQCKGNKVREGEIVADIT